MGLTHTLILCPAALVFGVSIKLCYNEQTDYTKYDELVETLKLSDLELAILNCYMNGMVQSEVCAELGIGRGTINHRKASIRKRYYAQFDTF